MISDFEYITKEFQGMVLMEAKIHEICRWFNIFWENNPNSFFVYYHNDSSKIRIWDK